MSIPLAYYKLPVSVYRFYQTKKDLIVEYAKTHYEVPVDFDANRITLSILHSYIGHLGGSAPRNMEGRKKTKAKKRKRCSHEGCTKHVQKGGVCIRHGAKEEDRKGQNISEERKA